MQPDQRYGADEEVVLCPAQAAGIMTPKDKIWLGLHAIGNATATLRETSNTAGHSSPTLTSDEASLHGARLPKGVERRSLRTLSPWSFALHLVMKGCNILPSYRTQGLDYLRKTFALAGPSCQGGGCSELWLRAFRAANFHGKIYSSHYKCDSPPLGQCIV